jgi:hypothetical protein
MLYVLTIIVTLPGGGWAETPVKAYDVFADCDAAQRAIWSLKQDDLDADCVSVEE